MNENCGRESRASANLIPFCEGEESRKTTEGCEGLFPLRDLIPEITDYSNMLDAYNSIIRNLEDKYLRGRLMPDAVTKGPEAFESGKEYHKYLRRQHKATEKRETVIAMLQGQIADGTFSITSADVIELQVFNDHKIRNVQSPRIPKRIGCRAVMKVLCRYVNPTFIDNTAAGIKGRGMHWLHNRMLEDMKMMPDAFRYYGQNDIVHFYDSIDQDIMKAVLREYVADPILLPILDSFITIMPQGLSKGVQSSLTFANMYLAPIHKKAIMSVPRYFLCHPDGQVEFRPLYYSYCDDTAFGGPDAASCRHVGDIYERAIRERKMELHASKIIRPTRDGLNMLGWRHFLTDDNAVYSLIRKSIKQKAARNLARVKSRKRRQQIMAGLKGMAGHADCKHLYYKLTHHHMKKFSELGVVYQPADGKKRFPGNTMRLSAIQNKRIQIHNYEKDVKTSHGDDRCLVSFYDPETKSWGKFFTSSAEMKNILDQISDVEDGFPFETVIVSEVFDGNKVKYSFS